MSPFLSPSIGSAFDGKGLHARGTSQLLINEEPLPRGSLCSATELLTPVLSYSLGGFIWNEAQKVALEEEA